MSATPSPHHRRFFLQWTMTVSTESSLMWTKRHINLREHLWRGGGRIVGTRGQKRLLGKSLLDMTGSLHYVNISSCGCHTLFFLEKFLWLSVHAFYTKKFPILWAVLICCFDTDLADLLVMREGKKRGRECGKYNEGKEKKEGGIHLTLLTSLGTRCMCGIQTGTQAKHINTLINRINKSEKWTVGTKTEALAKWYNVWLAYRRPVFDQQHTKKNKWI